MFLFFFSLSCSNANESKKRHIQPKIELNGEKKPRERCWGKKIETIAHFLFINSGRGTTWAKIIISTTTNRNGKTNRKRTLALIYIHTHKLIHPNENAQTQIWPFTCIIYHHRIEKKIISMCIYDGTIFIVVLTIWFGIFSCWVVVAQSPSNFQCTYTILSCYTIFFCLAAKYVRVHAAFVLVIFIKDYMCLFFVVRYFSQWIFWCLFRPNAIIFLFGNITRMYNWTIRYCSRYHTHIICEFPLLFFFTYFMSFLTYFHLVVALSMIMRHCLSHTHTQRKKKTNRIAVHFLLIVLKRQFVVCVWKKSRNSIYDICECSKTKKNYNNGVEPIDMWT